MLSFEIGYSRCSLCPQTLQNPWQVGGEARITISRTPESRIPSLLQYCYIFRSYLCSK